MRNGWKPSMPLTHQRRPINNMEKPRKNLKNIYDYITEGIILRSKAISYEEEEKPSKYFLSLKKSNKIKNCLCKLKWSEQSSQVTTDPECIMTRVKEILL